MKYSKTILHQLVEGFDKLWEDPNGADWNFLKVLLDAGLEKERYLMATMPISGLLYTSAMVVDDGFKKIVRDRCEYLMWKKESLDDLIFELTYAINAGAYGFRPLDLYSAFTRLCKVYSDQVEKLSPVTLRKVQSLREEIECLERNRFYLDFTSSSDRQVILPPLSPEKIQELSALAERLAGNNQLRNLLETEEAALEVLRFFLCSRARVCGYEGVSTASANALLQQSVLPSMLTSSYLISNWFYALSETDPFAAYAFFLVHREVLLKPFFYPTADTNPAKNFITFHVVPSRLAKGISYGCQNGNTGLILLDNLLRDEEEGRSAVDNEDYIRSLIDLLNDEQRGTAAELYKKHGSSFASLLEDEPVERKVWNTYSFLVVDDRDEEEPFSEEQFIQQELTLFDQYYDDRVYLHTVIMYNPIHMRSILQDFGYRFHPGIAQLALKQNPSVENLIPKSVLEPKKEGPYEWHF